MINEKLTTLLVLASELSFTKTAEICNISQPAVSQHVKYLENLYHIKIFNRVGKELVITNEGKILVKNAKRLIALNKNMQKEINVSLTHSRKLDIGITLTASGYFIPEIMNVFKEKFPHFRYNFHTDLAENIYERMKYYELDFAIIDGLPLQKEFEAKLLTKDDLIFIAPKTHPLAQGQLVSLSQLKKEKFILRHEKSHSRIVFENYLASVNESLDNFDVILEIDNTSLIKQLIIEGHGISVMSKTLCEINLRIGTIKEIKLADFKLERGIYLIYRPEIAEDELIQAIIQLART